MNLTDLALIGGVTCTAAGMLILALGIISRKPKQTPKPRQEEKDSWPNYQAAERKK